ncbi:MAG: glycosyltransferase [Planctomycetes bacterium]|nr:glycosyltransferase [Planctomycetota bacterium]
MSRVSVILSIFDQPRAFRFSLIGYQRQTYRDFELCIADDGSDDETKRIIEEFARTSDIPVRHVWQENTGYRRAKIANEAVKVSMGEIILLSDGDCIPHRDFVGAHAERGGPNTFCVGGYVRLSADASKALTLENVRAGDYENAMTSKDRRQFQMTHWKSLWGVMWGKMNKPKVYGCNISCGRDVYVGVNGYDENYDGFGKEDSDLRNRMRRYGARPVSLWGKAWVYHVDDVIDPKIRQRRVPRRKNPGYYYRKDTPIRCLNGLEKLDRVSS